MGMRRRGGKETQRGILFFVSVPEKKNINVRKKKKLKLKNSLLKNNKQLSWLVLYLGNQCISELIGVWHVIAKFIKSQNELALSEKGGQAEPTF